MVLSTSAMQDNKILTDISPCYVITNQYRLPILQDDVINDTDHILSIYSNVYNNLLYSYFLNFCNIIL